ncbi:MAG: hypothetical protein E6G35_01045 [Actinobacteria bacterium]|nr:MAG: hypothetical protein E6G35_01045 [Actinomycetota bacterium]
MRHLGTLIAAIVIAPAAWLLIAFGQPEAGSSFAKAQTTGAWPAGDFLAPLLLLAGAGLLLGLIGTLRFSPLGAVLTGLVYTASYVAVLFAGKTVNDLLNYRITITGHTADLRTPVASGATLMLGTLLLVSVVSVRRWRRWPAAGTEPYDEALDEGNGNTEDTRPFWPSSEPSPSPVRTTAGSLGSDEPTTERQFGSPWRTPPGDAPAEGQPR